MTREKNTISKKIKSKEVEVKEEEKVPAILEVIEERDDIVGPVDKMVADPLLEPDAVAVEGVEPEELGMDEEELDPFGDKWEA
jgi:hypothetical protein